LPLPPPPSSTLFPYTTLFRSAAISASEQVVKALHLNPFACFHIATLALQHDKAVALAEGAENVRALMAGGAHLQLALRVARQNRSEEHTSELQSRENLVCRLL